MLIFAALLAGTVIGRAVLPLRLSWKWKAGLSLAVLAAAFKFQLLHFFGGPMFFAPDLPEIVLLLSAWVFTALFLFFFLLIGADIVRAGYLLFLFCRKRKRTERFRIVGNRVNLALVLFAAWLAAVGIWNGKKIPEVREATVVLKNLPPEADGLRIAVLVDFHVDGLTGADYIGKIVGRTNALQPDLVVILGDFVDGTVALRGRELLPLKDLSARYGVYGVPGNHEYYSGYEEWMRFLPTLGIRMLPNTHVKLFHGGLILAGVTDPAAAHRGGSELPDVEKALANTPSGAVKILLSHQPRLAMKAAANGVDLQLSGHTHGGMIFGISHLVARFNAGFVSGFYRVGRMTLYVSNGSGIWNGFPIRLGVPSEITLLRLFLRDPEVIDQKFRTGK
ncbi:MAG: putative metallophosphoesterase [Lentisphaerae bacterium ADurb.Bin242]|nr:MAG: putative metallophosphoesterase [Lentisphaerae bacterium ADurb.Bin242]